MLDPEIASRFSRSILALTACVVALIPAARLSAQSSPESVLHSFLGGLSDGSNPRSSLIGDASGNLYGTTLIGGTSFKGTVFELVNRSGTFSEQILYTFTGGSDGEYPQAGLLMDASRNLYGTTASGGSHGMGTVFELVNNSGTYTEQILYNFSGGNDGFPAAGLIVDASGNLFGTTGGPSSTGTVFELVKHPGAYSEQILYAFTGHSDGGYPQAALFMDASGNLFGTTELGGSNNNGTVFELKNNSGTYTEQTLYSFAGGNDGATPDSTLVMDNSGNLYGATQSGGTSNNGTVFELVNQGAGTYAEQVLHSFTGGNDGANPYAGPIMDALGNLIGTTTYGGPGGAGTVFALVNRSGTYIEQVLYSFSGGSDGSFPESSLSMDGFGNLYGTTYSGGAHGEGTVFEAFHPVFTSLILSSSANPAFAGDTIAFTAVVSPQDPAAPVAGSIAFTANSVPLGTAPVANGSASISVPTSSLPSGTTTIAAQFMSTIPGQTGSSATLYQLVNSNSSVALTNGPNTFNGNQTVNGTVYATSFSGDGSMLRDVTAAGLTCAGCIGNTQLGINYALGDAQGGNAENALKLGGYTPSAFAMQGASNSFTGDQSITGSLTATSNVNAANGIFSAGVTLAPSGTATVAQAFSSGSLSATASLFNSNSSAPQNLLFEWQAEPAANTNNTANPAATLNLLYASGASPSETGLSVNPNGTINFAPGQAFPGTGNGTITGVTGGTGLTGGGTSGSVSLGVDQGVVAFQSDLASGINSAENFATNAATTAQNSAESFATNAANGAQNAAETFATNAANTVLGAADGFASTAAANAQAAAETYANNTFVPLAGGVTMTGSLTAPSLTSSGPLQGVSVAASGALSGGSLTIGGGTPIAEFASLTRSITLPALKSGACTTFKTPALKGFTPGTDDTVSVGISKSLLKGVGSGIFLVYQAWEDNSAASPKLTVQVCNPSAKYKGGATGAIRIDVFKH